MASPEGPPAGGGGGYDNAYLIAQTTQRLNTMEDLLHRNESSLSHVLNRMKDSEVALNSVHRITAKYQPEMALLLDDLTTVKRKGEASEQGWRSKIQELEGALQAEMRNGRGTPLANDPLYLRTVSEVQAMRQEMQDQQLSLKRLGETASVDSKAAKQTEQDVKWLTDQLRDQVAQHRDFTNNATRRIDQLSGSLADETKEREKGESLIQSVVEKAVRAVREEFSVRFEAEAKARISLQNDVVSAFARMREDVIKGFTQTASNLRNLDETAHSLETVLRAEVRSRMSTTDEISKRVETVEERVRREATGAAEILKQFDSQLNGALRDLRDVTQSENKSQLEQVWRAVKDTEKKLEEIAQRPGGGVSDGASEVNERRNRMQMDADLTKMKDDIFATMDRRIEAAVLPKETIATKNDLRDMRSHVELKGEEVLAESKKLHADADLVSRSTFDSRIGQVESRIEGSERNVTAVAEALHGAQRDLGDKVALMEKQARAVDAMQRNLQEAWDRDQQQMEGYLNGIREQVMIMAEDQRERNAEKTPGDRDLKAEAAPTTFKMLEDEMSGIRKKQRDFETAVARQMAELEAELAKGSSEELQKQVDRMKEEQANAAKSPGGVTNSETAKDLALVTRRVEKVERRLDDIAPTLGRQPSGRRGSGDSAASRSASRAALSNKTMDVANLEDGMEDVKHGQKQFEQKMMKEILTLRHHHDELKEASEESHKIVRIHTQEISELQQRVNLLITDDLPRQREELERWVEEALTAFAAGEEPPQPKPAPEAQKPPPPPPSSAGTFSVQDGSPTPTPAGGNSSSRPPSEGAASSKRAPSEAASEQPPPAKDEKDEKPSSSSPPPAQTPPPEVAVASPSPETAQGDKESPEKNPNGTDDEKQPDAAGDATPPPAAEGDGKPTDDAADKPAPANDDQKKPDDAAAAAPAKVCSHCGKPLTGSYLTIGDSGDILIHEECEALWREASAPKCTHCGKALMGEYVELKIEGEEEPAQLHEDCTDDYRKSVATKCARCKEPMMEGGVMLGDDPYHENCADEEEKEQEEKAAAAAAAEAGGNAEDGGKPASEQEEQAKPEEEK